MSDLRTHVIKRAVDLHATDLLPMNWATDDIELKLIAEEHRQGLEYGLSFDHCVLCRERYVQLHCPHEDTINMQTVSDPRPRIFCASCGKAMPAPW